MRRLLILPALILFLTFHLQAQQRTQIDVARLGPQVGQQVPDFALTDQTGTTRTLRSIMGPRGAMLVFIRSADW